MGRYYTGDIDGKFWFALQSSDAADRFGVLGHTPSSIIYDFQEDDLEDVEKEIKNIEESLGENKQKIIDFFEKNNGYNDKSLNEAGILESDLSDYADLSLGIQIRDCIKETGQCYFAAEL